jgi:hypothetical protein
VSTQNLKLIDRLVEPNFTYERGFQLCFWQFQRPKKFSHSLRSLQTFGSIETFDKGILKWQTRDKHL